jgi:hypothetical protein
MQEKNEIMEFIQSTGARNHFSTAYEEWQNELAEAAIHSIMRLARTIMAESGLGGKFWFKVALAGKDARNVTYNGQTSYSCIYGELKDVSRLRSFGSSMGLPQCRKEGELYNVVGTQF